MSQLRAKFDLYLFLDLNLFSLQFSDLKRYGKKVLCFVLTLKITVTNWNKSHGKFSDFSYQLFIIIKSSLNLFLKVITYPDFSVGYKSPLTYFLNYSPTIQLKSLNERELKRIITVSAVICLHLVYIYDVQQCVLSFEIFVLASSICCLHKLFF